jgi:hypothetical protein
VPPGHAPVTNPLYLNLVADQVMAPLLRGPDSIGSGVAALRRDALALARALRRRLGQRATGTGAGHPMNPSESANA